MKKNQIKEENSQKILVDLFGLSVLSIVCMMLPFASYAYKGVVYTISGIRFVTGTLIRNGQTTVFSRIFWWLCWR